MSRPDPAVARAALLALALLTPEARSESAPSAPGVADAPARVRALLRAGRAADAVTAARTALGAARGHRAVAELSLELARARSALREARRAERDCARIDRSERGLAMLCQLEVQLAARRGTTARPLADELLAAEPALRYEALVARGRAEAQLGEPEAAEATLREALALAPARPEAGRHLGELLIARGKLEPALVALRAARVTAPDDLEVALLLGERLPAGPEAREALQAALVLAPDSARGRTSLGRLLVALGEPAAAVEHLVRAAAVSPKSAEARALLAEARLRTGAVDEALADARAAVDLVPGHGLGRFVIAQALVRRGEIDAAIEEFEGAYGALRLDPRVAVEAARACLAAGRVTTARAFAERATADFPRLAAGWEVLGDAAVAGKEPELARSAYGKAGAAEGEPERARALRKLATLR